MPARAADKGRERIEQAMLGTGPLDNLGVDWASWDSGRSARRDPGGRHHPPGAGCGPPGRVLPRPGHVAEQHVTPAANLGWRQEALAAIQETVAIRRELTAKWPDTYHHELEQSLPVFCLA